MLRFVSCLLLLFAMAAVSACGREGVVNNPPVAPAISARFPADGEQQVPLNRAIAVLFTKSMNPATLTNVTFKVSIGSEPVAGTVATNGTIAVFKPNSGQLTSNSTYTVTVTTGARDTTGVPLQSDTTWTFKTGSALTTLSITSVAPTNNATLVGVDTVVTASFSEAMDPATITGATYTVSTGSTPVSGTVSLNGKTAVFTPAVLLTPNTTYTATVTGGVKDLAGNSLLGSFSWSFSTGSTLAPAVVSTTPVNLATGIVTTIPTIKASLNKAMNPATINPQTFTLTFGVSPGVPVTGAVSLDSAGTTATFTPAGPLQANTVYTATITTGATDTTGTSLSSNFSWSFTTGF